MTIINFVIGRREITLIDPYVLSFRKSRSLVSFMRASRERPPTPTLTLTPTPPGRRRPRVTYVFSSCTRGRSARPACAWQLFLDRPPLRSNTVAYMYTRCLRALPPPQIVADVFWTRILSNVTFQRVLIFSFNIIPSKYLCKKLKRCCKKLWHTNNQFEYPI